MTHATSATPGRPRELVGASRVPSTEWSDLFAQIYAQRNPRIFRPQHNSSFDVPFDSPLDSPSKSLPANPAPRSGSIMKNGRLRSEPH
jgi:hypothetical protein